MPSITLFIGNRNYSSWSLRPWILLRHLGLQFDEVVIPLSPAGHARAHRGGESSGSCRCCAMAPGVAPRSARTPASWRARGGRVIALPRARTRAVAAEMHAGFPALRAAWP